MHKSYESQLEIYHKAFFDPFKRSEKCMWEFPGNEVREVTLGQLCFLMWVIKTGIIDYIEANLPKIQAAMREHLSRPRTSRRDLLGSRPKGSRKRSPVQVTAIRERAMVGDSWIVEFG